MPFAAICKWCWHKFTSLARRHDNTTVRIVLNIPGGVGKKAKMRTRTIQAGSQIFHLSLSESSWVRNLRMAIGFSVCTVFGRTANRIDELSVYINFSVCSDGLNYSVEVFRDRSLFLWPMSEYKPQSTYWTPFCQERETYVRFIVKSILRWGSAHCLYWLK